MGKLRSAGKRVWEWYKLAASVRGLLQWVGLWGGFVGWVGVAAGVVVAIAVTVWSYLAGMPPPLLGLVFLLALLLALLVVLAVLSIAALATYLYDRWIRPGRPKTEYNESPSATGHLSLIFDLKTHRIQDGNLIQYFVGVRNTGNAPVDKASVTIEDIKSLDDPIGMARRLAKFRGWSLLLKEDMYKQNDPPKKDFYVFGHSDVQLIVMQGQTQYSWIYLEHTEGTLGPGVSANGLKAWTPVRRELPAGKYQLRLLLRGSDGTVQRKTFLASMDTERFDFEEDTAHGQWSNSVSPAV